MFVLTQVVLLASFAAIAPQGPAEPSEPQILDPGFGRGLFLVAEPGAAVSDATRINDDLASKEGVVPPPTPGFRVSDRVIVETRDAALLGDLLALHAEGAWSEPMPGAPGFRLVHAGSVADAIALSRALDAYFGDEAVYLDVLRPWTTRVPNDPMFGQQWHLRNSLVPLADANVEGAWSAGITGQGVVIGIVDGGVQTTHPDLDDDYLAAASQSGTSSSHGTSVAGVAAAEGDNGLGVAGAAYGAQWSKLYYGWSSDNAAAFGHRNDLNDIKNNSWGPSDNGAVHTMTSAERAALEDAVLNGRGGLGTVFCWAAGNGGFGDRVDYDPYASSRLTMAIGAIGDGDVRSWYNEQGSSMLAVAHSDGNSRGITTTAQGGGYTSSFGGTSSASPLGAGIVALMLEANPALTWRDVTAIVAQNGRVNDGGDTNWMQNAAGLDVNVNYGFGAMDATALVQAAQTWTNLPPEQTLTSGVQPVNQTIPDNDPNGLTRTVTFNTDVSVESVELVLDVSHTYVGDLFVKVTSPSGTGSVLAKQRNDSQNHYDSYVFTTLRPFGESSQGTWTVLIADEASGTTGTWNDFELIVRGHDPQPGGQMSLSSGTVSAGGTAVFSVSNGAPNASTWLAVSLTGTGSTVIPQLGVTVDLDQPFPAGPAQQTDANGDVTFLQFIPANAAGRAYWVQAVQTGLKSNLLSGTVQ